MHSLIIINQLKDMMKHIFKLSIFIIALIQINNSLTLEDREQQNQYTHKSMPQSPHNCSNEFAKVFRKAFSLSSGIWLCRNVLTHEAVKNAIIICCKDANKPITTELMEEINFQTIKIRLAAGFATCLLTYLYLL